MILYYFTSITLDIAYATTWWIISKTRRGVNYIMYGNNKNTTQYKMIGGESINNELLEKILKQNETQEILIHSLTDKIEYISNYLQPPHCKIKHQGKLVKDVISN
tara:strand:- start:6017 stop:6331 length:315 start_codon:yes stop_codon:yes gene_type:complete